MSQSPNSTQPPLPRETDSSSSRESSPERPASRKQRSFSPESESSDSVAPQITVHDSSPPRDQPVIPQGPAVRTVPAKDTTANESSVKAGDSSSSPEQQEIPPTAAARASTSQSPVALEPPLSSASSTPGPPASNSNPATPSPHLSAMSTPSDKSIAQKGTKRPAKQASKKMRQADDTSFTTGRFRLSQYSATPNDGPPLPHGQGTYASVYRTPISGANTTPPVLGPEPSSSSAPPSTTRIIITDAALRGMKRSSKPQSIQPSMAPARDEPPSTSTTQARSRSYPTRVPPSSHPTQIPGASLTNTIPRVSVSQSAPTTVSPMASPGGHSPTNLPTSGAYYRRNYEAGSHPSRYDHSRAPSTSVQMSDPRSMDATMAPPPDESPISQSKGKEREISGQPPPHSSEPVRPPRGNIRLVTALIEDNRSNPPDHLLAEVYIRCWSGGRPDELWCDAKDLSEALQASASRIDGPAKVYTQRGAYRQCFLRITAEQEDRYNSMNLALASDRTIPVSVEYWAAPGAQSKPGVDWRMPWHGSPTLSPAQRHAAPSQGQYYSYQHNPSSAHHPQHHHHQSQPHAHHHTSSHHSHYSPQNHDDGRQPTEYLRKRPSYTDQGPPDYPPESPVRRAPFGTQPSNHDPRYEGSAASRILSTAYPRKRHVADAASPTDDNAQGDAAMDTRPDYKNSGYASPRSEDRQVALDMMDELLRVDVTVSHYNRLIQSSKLYSTVQAYRMVEEICKKYLGRSLPLKGNNASHRITEMDIAMGLRAEDPRKFIAECRETLRLLGLYGERGKRYENPKILEMLKEGYRPDFNNVPPIKQLQKLLKDLDAQWMREHPEGSSDNTRSTPRMP